MFEFGCSARGQHRQGTCVSRKIRADIFEPAGVGINKRAGAQTNIIKIILNDAAHFLLALAQKIDRHDIIAGDFIGLHEDGSGKPGGRSDEGNNHGADQKFNQGKTI